jgi:hypothetical protein
MANIDLGDPVSFDGAARAATAPPRWMRWTGIGISALPVLVLITSAAMKLSHNPQMTGMWTGKLGYPEHLQLIIGLVELACVALYVAPPTAILGAILITGHLGGAIATHVRVGDPFVMPLLFGILAWVGLYLREPRLRALVPLRKR